MPDEELTLILKLRDEATKGLKSWRTQVVAAGAAVGAVGSRPGLSGTRRLRRSSLAQEKQGRRSKQSKKTTKLLRNMVRGPRPACQT